MTIYICCDCTMPCTLNDHANTGDGLNPDPAIACPLRKGDPARWEVIRG